MKRYVLSGSKEEIAKTIERIEGTICEVVVHVEEPPAKLPPAVDEDMFAEMEPYTVQVGDADDSREAIYTRVEGE